MSEAMSKLEWSIEQLINLKRLANGLDDIKDYVNGLRERVKELEISNEKKEQLLGLLDQWVLMLHGFVIETLINELGKTTKESTKG